MCLFNGERRRRRNPSVLQSYRLDHFLDSFHSPTPLFSINNLQPRRHAQSEEIRASSPSIPSWRDIQDSSGHYLSPLHINFLSACLSYSSYDFRVSHLGGGHALRDGENLPMSRCFAVWVRSMFWYQHYFVS